MDKKFLGVYSRRANDGSKTLYFVWTKNNLYSVQKLDKAFNPIDLLRTIDSMSFKSMFTHEPGLKQIPSAKKGAAPRTHLDDILSPENIENTMRSQFQKTLSRVKREGLNEMTALSLQTLAQVEEGIVPEHKHMFAEFSTQLRKGQHLEQALAFCKRTISLSPTDDHAHFNAARVLMDMGNFDDAEQHLLTAHVINPRNKVHDKALKHIAFLRVLANETPEEREQREKQERRAEYEKNMRKNKHLQKAPVSINI